MVSAEFQTRTCSLAAGIAAGRCPPGDGSLGSEKVRVPVLRNLPPILCVPMP